MLYQYVLQNGDQFSEEKRRNYFIILPKEISGNKRETTCQEGWNEATSF